MKYVLHRNFVLATTLGHAIEFKKGVPTEVPKILHREAIAIGAIPEAQVEEDDKQVLEAPIDPSKRQEDILAAFELIVAKADREDFTAAGLPHPRAVSKIVGYTIQAKERDEAWQVYLAAQEEEDDK